MNMKKFKKPLTISINEQQMTNIESPKQKAYCPNQRQLLMYNQHTIASSINNQNQYNQLEQEYYQNDKLQNNCEQYDQQNNGKNNYGLKLIEKDNKNTRQKKINVVEFQQFTINSEKTQSLINNIKNKSNNNNTIKLTDVKQHNKRDFTIEIPQNQQNKRITDLGLKQQTLNNSILDKKQIKQPPCPSHKSSVNFSNHKHFIFPVHDQQNSSFSKNSYKQIIQHSKTSTQGQHNNKITLIINQWQLKVQQLNKKFQKQRQQFYKQKSNLQKDLMIKDGQIQMLQKLITNRYQHKQQRIKNSQISKNQINLQQNYPTSHVNLTTNNIKLNQNIQHNIQDDKLKSLQTILLQKDLKLTQLLQKINQLNEIIQIKDTQMQTIRSSLIRQQKMTQSLKNQLFIFQRKNSNQKLTKQFYKIKQIYQNNQIQAQQIISQNSFTNSQSSNKTSKNLYQKKKHQLDQFLAVSKSKQKNFHRKVQNTLDRSMGQHYSSNQNNLNQSHQKSGIDDLHRRLQSLKMNRIQLQNRGKIKSQVSGYSQTAKYKPKGSFDFKGKYYEQTKSYRNNNINRNY